MDKVPDDFENIDDVMTNFDGSIEDGAEETLKTGKVWGGYAAWDFYGKVWFDGRFKCQIMQYHNHVNTIVADSLQEIMDEACSLYGSK